jgi:hypothetical protein
MIPKPRITVGAGEYFNRELRPCGKPNRVAEGFFDRLVVDLSVYELLLTAGADKDPLRHECLPAYYHSTLNWLRKLQPFTNNHTI